MFFFSLPIFFNNIRLVTPMECFLMAIGILALLYFSAPEQENRAYNTFEGRFLLAAWLGEVPLVWVFWPFFLLLNVSLIMADWLAKNAHITVSTWDEIHFVLFLGILWWATSVWRCSGNTSLRFWSALARFATVAVFAEYALMLLIRIDYPRIFFNCEEAVLDYASCF